jgi:hypothetical protein
MYALGVILIVIVFLILACCLFAFGFGRYIERVEQRLAALEKKTNLKRLPNKTIEGLEDAQAVLIDIAQEQQITELRLRQLHEILKLLRTNPLEYEYRPDGSKEKKESAHAE